MTSDILEAPVAYSALRLQVECGRWRAGGHFLGALSLKSPQIKQGEMRLE